MKYSQIIYLIIFIFCTVSAQDWVTAKYFKEGVPETDNFVDKIRTEMKSFYGKQASNFVFRRIDTDVIDSLSSLKGKTIIVSLWQTGCAPCIKELPDLQKTQNEFEKQDVIILYVSPESKQRQQAFLEKNKITLDGIKATMTYKDYVPPFQCMVNPSGLIIDKSFAIRDSWIGPQSFDSLKVRINKVLH